MRPIPAPRLGDAHGLLRAISQRERLRLDEFVTEFSVDELFPSGLENALGRTRQFVSFARAAGLLSEDRGVVELTEIGKRYVRAADDAHFFDLSSAQAEWLRRQLREKHMTDSIYHGAAIGLSLLASSPPDFRVSSLDFGRALAYLARAGWDNDNTFSSQGERYGVFLRDLELVDERWRLTSIGDHTRAELTLPIHMSLKDLAGQLNPGGVAAAVAEGETEWTAREARAAPPAPQRAVAPIVSETGEYHDVGPGAGPSRLAAPGSEPRVASVPSPARPPEPVASAPAPEPAPPPAPVTSAPPVPDNALDVAAPDEATGAYRTVGVSAAPAPTPPEPPRPTPPGPTEEQRRVAEAATRLSVKSAPHPAAPGPATTALRAAAAQAVAPSPAQPARAAGGFLDLTAVRAAGEQAGLRLPASAYAAALAALATGRHVVLTGPTGSGKTTLALALARAAAAAGRAAGTVLVTARRRWSSADTLGRVGAAGFEPGHVLAAAQRDRWLILDELDRAHLDRALGALSTFLGGLPVTLPDGAEAKPPPDWRIVATADARRPLDGSPALLRRFARVDVPPPDDGELAALIESAAGGDSAAAAAVRRLLAVRELREVGAGIFVAAARHAAERNALAPAGEGELARECLRAYVLPLLGELDPDEETRLRALAP